jgi:NADP-dependent aldehyde dehydrogenase
MQNTSLIGFSVGEKNESSFHAVNPSTGEASSVSYFSASENEVVRACELAESAKFEMAGMSGMEKAIFLRLVADRIEQKVGELVKVATFETGLPEGRIRGETTRTCGQLRMFAALVEEGSWVDARIDSEIPDREPVPKPDLRSMLRPVGPVAVFCASNFPLAFSVAGGDTASAWAAGCPVIVKAHHAHPGTALLVGEIVVQSIKDSKMPEGCFSLLFGEGRTIGQSIVKQSSIKAVGFTGSRAGGRAIFDLASSREEPIPVFAEMSSINPIFLLPDMDLARMNEVAEGLYASATMGVGQFCTNPGVVFYPDTTIGHSFKDTFLDRMNEFEPGAMLHVGIKDSYYGDIDKMSRIDGVRVLSKSRNEISKNCYVRTAVLGAEMDLFLKNPELSNEIFGPATMLISYKNESELISAAEILDGQLTASIFGSAQDLTKNDDLVSILETKAGRLLFNQFPTGVEVCESIVHGGPYPATTDGRSTSVGTGAILRFTRPVCYQGFPDSFLPDELKESNPLNIRRKKV